VKFFPGRQEEQVNIKLTATVYDITKPNIPSYFSILIEMLTILLTHISQSIFLNVGQISESMKVKDSERLARSQLCKSTHLQKYLNMHRWIVKRLA
jgi:hypothetical protein